MRYEGQSFELGIKVGSGDLAESFHRAHQARYGYAKNPIEVVTVRLRSSGLVKRRKQDDERSSPGPWKLLNTARLILTAKRSALAFTRGKS